METDIHVYANTSVFVFMLFTLFDEFKYNFNLSIQCSNMIRASYFLSKRHLAVFDVIKHGYAVLTPIDTLIRALMQVLFYAVEKINTIKM